MSLAFILTCLGIVALGAAIIPAAWAFDVWWHRQWHRWRRRGDRR